MDDLGDKSTAGTILPDVGGELPGEYEWRVSKDGKRFNPRDDIWPLTSKRALYVSSLREQLSAYPVLLDGAIRTLASVAENCTVQHTHRLTVVLGELVALAELTDNAITWAAVANYRAHTYLRDGHDANGMHLLRPFLTLWNELGYPGVSASVVERMREWILKSPERHVRVNRRDPQGGPLTSEEQWALEVGARNAYEAKQITLSEFMLYRLFMLSGRRAAQFTRLKCEDMDDSRTEEPRPNEPPKRLLLLHIPRIKGRRGWREHFRTVPLPLEEWNLLMKLRTDVVRKFDTRLTETGLILQQQDRKRIHEGIPLFPGWTRVNRSLKAIRKLVDAGSHGEAITLLRQEAESDAWETDTTIIRDAFDRVVKASGVRDRAGELLTVFPTRLRYTLVSNLERLGCPRPVIAYNLDHDDFTALPSYSRNSPDKAARWSKATEARMRPIAAFFSGKVVDHESDAVGGDDPESSRLVIINAEPGATCAVKRNCGIGSIPRACYDGCLHFQPWVDGPHEAFLEVLLEEREEFFNGLDPIEERAIIEVADTLILAVLVVIHLCAERRGEIKNQITTEQPNRRGDTK
ncbi:MAG TPA: hypothetical protein VJ576_13905 [Rhodocyclaceae bacterium]|nr:hypothetical protein [Rhodocyclaceae bacterium]